MRQLLLLVPILVVFFSINSFGAVLVEPAASGEEVSMVEQLETQLGRELTRREMRKVKRWERRMQKRLDDDKPTVHPYASLSVSLSIISLLGYFGIFISLPVAITVIVLGILLSSFAVFLGLKAQNAIHENPDKYRGGGTAFLGIFLGFLSFAVAILLIILLVQVGY